MRELPPAAQKHRFRFYHTASIIKNYQAMKTPFLLILAFAAAVTAGCSGKTGDNSTLYNQAASFSVPAGLPAGFLEWKVICTMIDRKHQTMSTLYGNDTAVAYARSNRQSHYPKES